MQTKGPSNFWLACLTLGACFVVALAGIRAGSDLGALAFLVGSVAVSGTGPIALREGKVAAQVFKR